MLPVLQGTHYIGNEVRWKRSHRSPEKLIALVRFQVRRFALPLCSLYKEIDTFIVGLSVHHPSEAHMSGLKLDTDLLFRLSRSCLPDGLSPFNVTRRNAVFAILVPCVESANEEDLVIATEDNVNGNRKQGNH